MIRHEVITTEKVPFSYGVAGLGSRFLAWLVDAVVMFLLIFAGLMGSSVLEPLRPGTGIAVFYLWAFLVLWGYFLFFEWLGQGRTPGKYLLGIRVIHVSGTSISFFSSAVRNLLRFVDGLPSLLFFWGYGLGFAVAAGNAKYRRLGDWAANTLVVHVERRPRLIHALQGAEAERWPQGEAQVRQRLGQLTRPQKQVILDLCLRREQLRLNDRVQLFRAVADYLKAQLDLQPGEHQSDEKFVVQLAAVLAAGGR